MLKKHIMNSEDLIKNTTKARVMLVPNGPPGSY